MLLFCFVSISILQVCFSGLYPRESPTREVKSLDGVWKFKTSPKMDPECGFREKWFSSPFQDEDVIDMPVPSSYNDITTDPAIRDYVGWVWYGRKFFIPPAWKEKEVFIRFGSVHYTCIVFINGKPVLSHSGGHIAFQGNISNALSYSEENWITVAVNNTLTRSTIPQGSYVWQEESDRYPANYSTLDYNFDFFNYAGIHRPVLLYAVPRDVYISDITVTSRVSDDLASAVVSVDLDVADQQPDQHVQCVLSLLDKSGSMVGESHQCHGEIRVNSPKLWWPYLMSKDPGYMYNLKVTVSNIKYGFDSYTLPIGLREVSWTNSSFKINHQNFYFRGVGKHEDSAIRGKGLDLPLALRDYNLLRWLGANSYRTSHYPYADEIMDLADQYGIVIIDECPAVALDYFDAGLLRNHLVALKELVDRDKNRPSVLMWSVGNEPRSYRKEAGDYFEKVYAFTRSLDKTRPITLVINADYKTDLASPHFDVICINRYFAWYSDPGHLELITRQMLNDLKHWRAARGKPVLVSEYGADTIAGIHSLPSIQFSEEYQIQLMHQNFKAFDAARAEGWFIGEMIWNFADFQTKQEDRRVAGNKKGLFTRDRQPKMSAHFLARRYWSFVSGDFSRTNENLWIL